jgi:preprotein translocase subunit SecD
VDQRFSTALAILLLVGTSLACSMLRTKRPLTWRLTLEIDAPASDRDAAMKQTIAVLESRLNALGIFSFEVKPQGDPASGRILLSLPDSGDRERLKRVITAAGKLELVHVITPPSPAAVQTYATKKAAVASLNSAGTIPSNRRVLPYTERADLGSAMPAKWVVVESPAIINGSDLRNASAIAGNGNDDYEISFSLRKEGADKFGSWTGANIDQYLGVVLNDEVRSIAFIKSQISDQGVIEGRFTKQAAEDLALILKSGSLPFPVKLVGES